MIQTGAGPQGSQNKELVLVQVSRVFKNRNTTETTWAKPLGGELYQIKGPLHLISGLNFDDIVKARPPQQDSIPLFVEVVTRSGYRTLHVGFAPEVAQLKRSKILTDLRSMNIKAEMLSELFWTLHIDRNGEYQAACDYLTALSAQQILMYEPEAKIDAVLKFCFRIS